MFFIIAEYITKFGFIFYNPHSEPIEVHYSTQEELDDLV